MRVRVAARRVGGWMEGDPCDVKDKEETGEGVRGGELVMTSTERHGLGGWRRRGFARDVMPSGRLSF